MESEAVAAPVPTRLTEAAEQVGSLAVAAPAGAVVTAHVNATAPVKPLVGVAVMVDVPEAPGDAIVTAVPARVKPGVGAAVTVRVTAAVCVRLPEVPVTVRV
jgi:hypothetical protein